jgi:hypothetical protein
VAVQSELMKTAAAGTRRRGRDWGAGRPAPAEEAEGLGGGEAEGGDARKTTRRGGPRGRDREEIEKERYMGKG